MRGFEPPTPSSRTKCATRLRHIPKFLNGSECLHAELILTLKQLTRQLYQTVGVRARWELSGGRDGVLCLLGRGEPGDIEGACGFDDTNHLIEHRHSAGLNRCFDKLPLAGCAALHGG